MSQRGDIQGCFLEHSLRFQVLQRLRACADIQIGTKKCAHGTKPAAQQRVVARPPLRAQLLCSKLLLTNSASLVRNFLFQSCFREFGKQIHGKEGTSPGGHDGEQGQAHGILGQATCAAVTRRRFRSVAGPSTPDANSNHLPIPDKQKCLQTSPHVPGPTCEAWCSAQRGVRADALPVWSLHVHQTRSHQICVQQISMKHLLCAGIRCERSCGE